jgi:carboxymethylenebutenolidase
MKRLILVLALTLFAKNAFTATATDVSYKSGDETVHGMLYTPAGAGPFPAIVAVHEWWGLNDWVKEEANKLADQGYVVLAVDLYRGKVAQNADTAHQLMRGVPPDRANRDLQAAVAFLKSQKNVKADRIGSIGWCMGGGYSLDIALLEPTLAATVINYGHLVTDPSELKKIHAAILGNFGAQDQGITPDDVNKFEQQLKSLGKSVDIKIYPDAGHAFENPNNKDGYRAADTADAWQRIAAFFAAHLKS